MRSLKILTLSLAVAVSGLSTEAIASNGKGKHKQKTTNAVEIEVDVNFSKAVFTNKERRIVRDYFHDHNGSLPPGLAKQKSLPPGLKKQLRNRGQLPPGLAKRRLPDDLVRTLPAYHGPYERTIVGNDLILLDPKTGLILDVMQEIFDVPVDETLQKAGARRVSY